MKPRIRTACYETDVDAAITYRLLADVAAMRHQSSESPEIEVIGCLSAGVKTVHSKTEDEEVFEFHFPNKLAAIDRLNNLSDVC